MVRNTKFQAAIIAALAVGACGQSAMAEEPVWDQAAYEALGAEAQRQYRHDYKAAVQAGSPPQTLQVQSRPVTPVETNSSISKTLSTEIRYDDGIMTDLPGTNSNMYGNRFDTVDNSGQIPDSATVSQVQFYMNSVGGPNVFVSAFNDPNSADTVADPIGSASVPAVTGWNTVAASVAIPGTGITNAFAPVGQNNLLVGVWFFNTDVPALGSGTVDGQGHHGIQINDIVGTGYQEVAGLNALFRLNGSNLPVEMIDFTIE